MIQLTQDDLVDTFLLNPCEKTLAPIHNKELTLNQLRKVANTLKALLFLQEKGDDISGKIFVKTVIITTMVLLNL